MGNKIFKKRGLSMLLTVVMVFSLLGNGSTVRATEGETTVVSDAPADDAGENTDGKDQTDEVEKPGNSDSDTDTGKFGDTDSTGDTDETGNADNTGKSDDAETPGNDDGSSEDGQDTVDTETSNDADEDTNDTTIIGANNENNGAGVPVVISDDELEDISDDETDGIEVETEGTKATVKISGTVSWKDIEKKLASTEGTLSEVDFVGDNNAVIQFMTDSDKLSFGYDVLFDNVCLEAGYSYNASTTNTGKSGCFIKLFANGHNFVTKDTVTTTGRVRVFGGGNETSVEDTYVYLEGGAFDLVVGGSYANATGSDDQGYGETPTKVTANKCTVYIGLDASAKGVVGGCLGGVNTGDITVTYASTASGNMFVSGSSSDAIKEYAERSLANSASRVDNPDGTITVTIAEGAVAGNVQGTMYSNVDVANVNVINNGTVTNIYGCVGSNDVYVSSRRLHYSAYGVYPGGDYYMNGSAKKNYEVNANVNITNNGTVTSTIYGGYYDANIKTVNITNNGSTEYIYGGGYEGICVTDTINVEVGETGTASYVFGGRMTGSWAIYKKQECNINVTVYGKVGCVFGGGHDSLTIGDVTVNIYGAVLAKLCDNKAVSGGVYGGGWITSTAAMQESGYFLDGTATVNIYPGATVEGNVCGGAIDGTVKETKVSVSGTVNGDVYGGGWTQEEGKVYPISYNPLILYYFGVTGSSYVEVGNDAVVGSVYGGGQMADVTNDSAVLIKDNATVKGDVCGAGNPYTTFYYGSTQYTFSSYTKNVSGDASVTIQDNASIEGTIYGYRALDGDEDYDYVKGTETVTFDGASGTFNRVMTAEAVVITNDSDITIDYNGDDYKQLYYVSDLTIDNGGKLTLPSSAYITGDYTGDKIYTSDAETDNRGTLALAAGKLLDVEGTVSGWTKLSIIDDENTDPVTKPIAEQVYVISEAGSSPTDDNAGKFTWIDQRNCVLLDWNDEVTLTESDDTTEESVPAAAEEGGEEEPEATPSEWWLVPMEATATIKPVSITAYEGGTSVNGNHIPKLRFAVETKVDLDEELSEYNADVSLNVNDLSFTLYTKNKETDEWKEEHLNRSRIDDSGESEDTYCLFPLLDADLGNIDTEGKIDQLGTYLKLVDTTENSENYAGVYAIQTNGTYGGNGDWYITASVKDADNVIATYPVDLVTTNSVTDEEGNTTEVPIATVTIRKVSNEDEMYDNPEDYLTQVVNQTGSIDTSERKAYALFPKKTEFLTNGDSSLGLLGAGENGYTDEDDNQIAENELIALLFDDMTTLSKDVDELQSMMMELAEDGGITTNGWEKEYRYLDLVNANDGNIVITADQQATVYWPYPDGITVDNAANYDFQILHYTGMNRENIISGDTLVGTDIGVESIAVTPTKYGLKFTTDSFSPFVLLYKAKNIYTLTLVYDQGWKETGEGTPDVKMKIYAGTEVDMTKDTSDWYEDKDYQTLITAPFTMTGDKEIYAKEKPEKTVTLTLVYDQLYAQWGIGTPDKTIEYKVGAEVDMSEVDGSVSWYEDEGFKNLITAPFTMNEDKTIYAGGTIDGGGDVDPGTGTTIVLNYNPTRGQMKESVRDEWGKAARTFGEPTDVDFDDPEYIPTCEGYIFDGWYTDFGYSTKVEGIVTVSTNMNVYAKWEKAVTLTLVYDQLWHNGNLIGLGTTPDVTIEMAPGTVVDMSEVDGSVAWFEDDSCQTKITEPFTMTEDKTVYTRTTLGGDVATFHLTYVSNGGAEFEYKVRGFTKATVVDFTDSAYIPTREGYTFTGWYTDEATQTEPLTTLEVSEDMTVWAGWKEKTYTLTLVYDQAWHNYNSTMGIGDTPDVIYEYKAGSEVDMSEVDGSVSWYEDEDFKNLITALFTMNEDKTIYAGTALDGNKEQKVTLTLVYDTLWHDYNWIGLGTTPDVTIEMAPGTVVDMSEVDGSVAWYEDNGFKNIINASFTMNADKTIYASVPLGGNAATFHLTYVSNGGAEFEYKVRGFTKATVVDFTDSAYIPTREGYTFTGWYTDEATQTEPLTTLEVSEDMTVWAGWEEKTVIPTSVILTLVYDQNWQSDGTGTPEVTITMDIGTVVDMSKVDGSVTWYEDKDWKTQITDPFTMNENKTIYAKSTSDNEGEVIHLIYVSNGGKEFDYKVRTVAKGTDVNFDDPDYIPTREKYEFTGWYTDEATQTEPLTTLEVSEDMTVWAGWEQVIATLTMVRDQNWKTTHTGIPDISTDMPVGTIVDMTGDAVNWYEDPEYTMLIEEPFVLTEDKTIYAKEETYTLTLVYDQAWHNYNSTLGIGDTPDVIYEYKAGTEVDMNKVDGSVNWYEDEDWKKRIEAPFTMDADKTIYTDNKTISGGGGEANPGDGTKIEVYYSAGMGHMNESLNLYSDSVYERWLDGPQFVDFDDPTYFPTYEGYVFTGWYKERWAATKVEGTIWVSQNMNVFAGWKKAEEGSSEETPEEPTTVLPQTDSPTKPTTTTSTTTSSTKSSKKSSSGSTTSTDTVESSNTTTISGGATGDRNHPALWFSLLLFSGIGMITVLAYRRKKRTE